MEAALWFLAIPVTIFICGLLFGATIKFVSQGNILNMPWWGLPMYMAVCVPLLGATILLIMFCGYSGLAALGVDFP